MISWGEIDNAELEMKDAIYFIPILAIMIISPLDTFFPQIDPDSARYLLSSLVQSEAAIIAIIISLSLVTVQIAASSYSARVIDIFRNSHYLWTLLWFYLISMTYSLYVLMMIKNEANLHLCADIFLSFIFGILAFFALIPFILLMFRLLRPSKTIDMLSQEITLENLLQANVDEGSNEEIQPIIDTITSSMLRYDEGTTSYGLKTIESKVIAIIKQNDLKDPELQKKFVGPIAFWLYEIGSIAVNQNDEYAIRRIIETLEHIAISAEELELDIIASAIINSIADIGEGSVKNRLEYAGTSAAISLRTVGVKSIEKNLIATPIKTVSRIHSFYLSAEENKVQSTKAFLLSALQAIKAKSNESRFFEQIFESELGKALDKAMDENYYHPLIDIFACYNMLGLKAQTEATRDQLRILGLSV
jgi:hypothetical protein